MKIYLLGLVFIGILLVSFYGYGYIFQKTIIKKPFPYTLLICIGICEVIFIGGILNLFKLISPALNVVIVAIGFFVGILRIIHIGYQRKSDFRLKKLLDIKFIIIFVILLISVLSGIYTNKFNTGDDFQAYFVYPNKMLQTGSIGVDQFSDRLTISSFGGKYYLDSIVLTFFSETKLNIIDQSISLLLIAFLLFEFGLSRKIDKQIIFGVLLSFLILAGLIVNITSYYLATLLLLAMLWVLFYYPKEFLAFAMLASAIITMKFTFLFTVLMLVALYLWKGKLKISLMIKTSLALMMLLLPWSISSFQNSGTFLYGVLGYGIESEYGVSSFENIQRDFPIFLINLLVQNINLIIIWLLLFLSNKNTSKFLIFISILSAVIIMVLTGGYGLDRYTAPFINAIIFFLILQINSEGRALQYLIIGMLIALNTGSYYQQLSLKFKNISEGLNTIDNISSKINPVYRTIQKLIPENENILIRVRLNYTFDFKRNNILLMDYPGAFGPSPGYPRQKDALILREYLLKNNVKYIIYDMNEEDLWLKSIDVQNRLANKGGKWIQREAINVVEFNKNMKELKDYIIYDDETTIVYKLDKLY